MHFMHSCSSEIGRILREPALHTFSQHEQYVCDGEADAAGPGVQRLSEKAVIGLAGLVPLSLIAPDASTVQKASDTAMSALFCLHSHIHINSVLSDYVPKSTLGSTRVAALAVNSIALLGLCKLTLAGPGLTPTVKKFWASTPPSQ